MHYGHCELFCERNAACLIVFIECKQPLGGLIALSLTLSSSVCLGTSQPLFFCVSPGMGRCQ